MACANGSFVGICVTNCNVMVNGAYLNVIESDLGLKGKIGAC